MTDPSRSIKEIRRERNSNMKVGCHKQFLLFGFKYKDRLPRAISFASLQCFVGWAVMGTEVIIRQDEVPVEVRNSPLLK